MTKILCEICNNIILKNVNSKRFCSIKCRQQNNANIGGRKRKGKTYEEIFGIKKGKILRKKKKQYCNGKTFFSTKGMTWEEIQGLKSAEERRKNQKERNKKNKKWQKENNPGFRKFGNLNVMSREDVKLKHKKSINKFCRTPKNRRKHRESRINQIRKDGGHLQIGTNEIQILNEFELSNNIKLIRQYEKCGYIIDGYCKELNLVVEVYESHHKYQIEKDSRRKQEIINELNCNFIEIEDNF
ncbi:DUF559 domain-containing protein [Candidatus Pacearchaeota archaeon]|nr:DUF559 domain-containing protein [Candidatus Pacearchaeota archaeon]